MPAAASQQPGATRRTTSRLWILNDEPAEARTQSSVLRRAGHETTIISGSAELAGLEASQAPDVIFVDLPLGEVDGLELLADLNRRMPSVPIVVTASSSSVERAVDLLRSSRVQVLNRPFDARTLVGAVAHALRQRADEPPGRDGDFGQSAAELRQVIEHSSDLIALLDVGGRFRCWSSSTRTILGRSDEELRGREVLEFVHPDDRASLQAAIEGLLDSPSAPATCELRMGHAERGWRQLDSRLTCTDVRGSTSLVLNAQDVSERRVLEAQLRQAMKMEAVGQLTGGIAHDFNNLLTAVLVNLDLACEALRNQASPLELVVGARSAAARGQELIQHLLAFARRQELEPQAVELAAFVRQVRDFLAVVLGERIEVETSVGPDAGHALADRSQLESALLNLAVNARDAMPDGGRFRIDVRAAEASDLPAADNGAAQIADAVLIAVSDTGEGMPPAVRQQACDPFFTTKNVGQGSGLGLSMVHGFVKQAGGRLRIESQERRGTRVELYLPRVETTSGSAAAPHAAEAEPSPVGARILLVEEQAPRRLANRQALEARGHQVVEAENSAEALEILEGGEALDLMVSDLSLPGGLDGRLLARRARKLRAGLRVLLTTGNQGAGAPDTKAETPLELILRDPFEQDELVSAIERLLSSSE